jgi:hypothetical protein
MGGMKTRRVYAAACHLSYRHAHWLFSRAEVFSSMPGSAGGVRWSSRPPLRFTTEEALRLRELKSKDRLSAWNFQHH